MRFIGKRIEQVSTHSRPKAAGHHRYFVFSFCCCFNTQPPEGGWLACQKMGKMSDVFQHTAARRRLVNRRCAARRLSKFQHTAARRRLAAM